MLRAFKHSLGGLASGTLLLLGVQSALLAAPTTYLHVTDPTCLGNSPCFADIESALQGVDNGGTVILLSDITGSIRDTESRQNITLMGISDTIEIATQILLEETVTGWTIKDLQITNSCIIQDVAGSLTIDNVTANIIKVGDLTQDTTANLTVRNSTVRGEGAISILGTPGASLGGSVLIENNVAGSVRIQLNVDTGPPTTLDADVTIINNELLNAGGISVLGNGTSGEGGINGAIDYSHNSSSADDAKFGVITFGNVTGDIAGPVTLDDNQLAWLAVLTTGSIAGGLGQLTVTNNTVEALEFVANGGAIAGPVLIRDNDVLDLGGHTGLDNPLILIDGQGVGDVTIEYNTAPDADVVTRATDGVVFGTARILGNQAGLLTLDSQGGDFGSPLTVVGNFLPLAADPRLSKITIRALEGGDSAGGTIAGNSSDELIVNFEGFLTADLTTNGNLVREQSTLISSGNLGGANHTLTGNDLQGNTLLNGLDSLVRFNRLGGDISVIQGTAVDASLNWWGCNAGPGAPGCSEPLTAGLLVSPWLTFGGEAVCSGSRAVATFDLLTASDGSTPSGNVTPGSIVVATIDGTVINSPVSLLDSAGCSNIDVQEGIDNPTISLFLDAETVLSVPDCTTGESLPPCTLFADGFESADTSTWSTTVP